MVYTVLIVDDEFLIRKGMRQFLDWEQYGFTIIGEVANGLEALKFAKTNQVDLMITDIRMPGLDGLELVEKLHENNLYPYVTILSGYGEFEYARKAIEREVLSYLLKPIEEEALIDMLKRAKCKLDETGRKEVSALSITEQIIQKLKPEEPPKRMAKEILEYMESNLGSNLSLEQIGEKFLLSSSYVSSLLKKQLGTNFQSILIDMRMLKAKELLATQYTLKIYEIANLVGYEDVQYFDRLFKKKEGISPREFRDSLK